MPASDPRTYDYSSPAHRCDMVMKGGITSGVVYPLAACEIARAHRFKSIGGTSAGAIAATAAAAAEHGRSSTTGGFRRLAELPDWLGAGTNLLDLFQPQRRTRRLYRVLTASLGKRGRFRRIAAAVLRSFPLWVLGGMAPGVVLLVLAARGADGWLLGWSLFSGVVLLVAGGALGTALPIYLHLVRRVPANRFGLCSGGGPTPRGGVPPLTTWLADEIDVLAGRPGGDPLTFGDLWRGPGGTGTPEDRELDLEMMTTSLTHGRPYRVPLSTQAWFFDPAAFRELFPDRVVGWMERHPPAPPREPMARRWWEVQCKVLAPLRPLPEAADLPVVVGARMSLSFPLLISAVPLHAVDWTRTANQAARTAWQRWLPDHVDDWDRIRDDPGWGGLVPPTDGPTAEVCWFSDGGITSNFPVHFFDAPIPRWPTFAINLGPYHPDFPPDPTDECRNVWLPEGNAGGIAETWTRIEERPGLRALAGFVHTIADTMQNWMDNTQIRVPGYRDRVAHIRHTEEEGGMNLDMPPERIAALGERGRCAGEKLVERFTGPARGSEVSWDNHRWVRYRSATALLEDMLVRFRRAYTHPPAPGTRTYEQLIRRGAGEPPTSYEWERAAQRGFASAATDEVVGMIERWAATGQSFQEGAPRPRPELRIRPRA
ncbi:MAG: patatin-like phospholipase family protein [Actinobacteria bacterium]|nr:patatin-like phospholipase family protein [Actinomycetota bacterium]